MNEFLKMCEEYYADKGIIIRVERPLEEYREVYVVEGADQLSKKFNTGATLAAFTSGLENYHVKNMVELIAYGDTFMHISKSYNCQDWAFDFLGMQDFTRYGGSKNVNILLKEDFEEIKAVDEPRKNDLIAYSKLNAGWVSGLHMVPKHWGIVSDVEGGHILVSSKWGECENDNVYNAPLELMIGSYGNYISFYRKVNNSKQV